MMDRIRQAWDRATLYLPVFLMGMLALGTWWLVRNAPQPIVTMEAKPVAHEPDYIMRDFSMKSFGPNGALTGDLRGTEARHYPDNETIEVDKVRNYSISPAGQVTRATANKGLSNADGSEVQLFGNAVITREAFHKPGEPAQPRMMFEGEFLHAWPNQERVTSNLPVVLTRGQDRFTADRMDYDNLDQVLQLKGRVRGVMYPRSAQ
jgi:lipopolysaccharide export system protein LptC